MDPSNPAVIEAPRLMFMSRFLEIKRDACLFEWLRGIILDLDVDPCVQPRASFVLLQFITVVGARRTPNVRYTVVAGMTSSEQAGYRSAPSIFMNFKNLLTHQAITCLCPKSEYDVGWRICFCNEHVSKLIRVPLAMNIRRL